MNFFNNNPCTVYGARGARGREMNKLTKQLMNLEIGKTQVNTNRMLCDTNIHKHFSTRFYSLVRIIDLSSQSKGELLHFDGDLSHRNG